MKRETAKGIGAAGVALAALAGLFVTKDVNCLWALVIVLLLWVLD